MITTQVLAVIITFCAGEYQHSDYSSTGNGHKSCKRAIVRCIKDKRTLEFCIDNFNICPERGCFNSAVRVYRKDKDTIFYKANGKIIETKEYYQSRYDFNFRDGDIRRFGRIYVGELTPEEKQLIEERKEQKRYNKLSIYDRILEKLIRWWKRW